MGTFLLGLHIFPAVCAVFLLFTVIYKRRAQYTLYFTYLAIAMLFCVAGYVVEFSAASVEIAFLGTQIEYFGVPFIAPFMLLYVMDFCKIRIRPAFVAALMAFPVTVCILVLTWPINHLYYSEFQLSNEILPHAEVKGSIFHTLQFVYSYLAYLAAAVVAFKFYKKRDSVFRKHVCTVVLAAAFPFIGNIIHIFFNIPAWDLTPILLSILFVCLTYALFKSEIFQIVPLARDQIVETMSDGFILVDSKGGFLDANAAAKTMFPQLSTASIGVPIKELSSIAFIENDKKTMGFELDTKTGVKSYQASFTHVMYEDNLICACIMIYDITEFKHLMDELQELATHDTLTGLFNRSTFLEMANQRFEELKRYGGTCAILMVDIDFFKKVNDTYGHFAGDEALRVIAKSLGTRLRTSDLLARYGGEEFCVFLPAANEEKAIKVAEDLRETIQKNVIDFCENKINLSISVGVANFTENCQLSLEALLMNADEALYFAKHTGRNKVAHVNHIKKEVKGVSL